MYKSILVDTTKGGGWPPIWINKMREFASQCCRVCPLRACGVLQFWLSPSAGTSSQSQHSVRAAHAAVSARSQNSAFPCAHTIVHRTSSADLDPEGRPKLYSMIVSLAPTFGEWARMSAKQAIRYNNPSAWPQTSSNESTLTICIRLKYVACKIKQIKKNRRPYETNIIRSVCFPNIFSNFGDLLACFWLRALDSLWWEHQVV